MQDGFYERSERDFAAFTKRFPKSELRPEVIQLQAECRFKLKNFDGVIELLNKQFAAAGIRQDEYLFWIAEAQFQKKDYAAAAAQYEKVLQQFPASGRVLEASYGRALALLRSGNIPKAIELLDNPAGPFQQAAKAKPDDERVIQGLLLLGEALFSQKNYAAGEAVLKHLAGRKLDPEMNWRRQNLQCRILLADGRLEAARAGVTNLNQYAVASGQRVLEAESAAMEGEILERLHDLPGAVRAYERNLANGLPEERRKQALTKVIDLTLAENKPADTIQKLNRFVEQNPKDPSLDMVRLTIGELHLNEYNLLWAGTRTNANVELLSGGTNLLQQARQQFDRLITDFPQSLRLPKAHLDRGWCWLNVGNYPNSLSDFKAAAETLPKSEDQARARVKWADCQFQLGDYAGAVTNYQKFGKDYAGFKAVKRTLFEQALYQIVRAGIALQDLKMAADATHALLTQYGDSALAPHAMLLVGQAYNKAGKTTEARVMLQDCARRFPQSELIPEVNLAVARSYEVDRDWPQAITVVGQWLAAHSNHSSRPLVEFNLGWLYSSAGQETNALNIYTNFVARYPTNELARLAQMCIADYYFNRGLQDGKNYVVAEENYQRVFQNTNWPPSEINFEARLAAGRSAFARSGFAEAREYFTNLINDARCPSNVVAKALFGLGDSYIEEPADSDKSLKKFEMAIIAFSTISTLFPGSPLEPAAWGKIGNCHLQLASQEPGRYAKASEFYQKAVDSKADIAVRSQGKYGLGLVAERQAAVLPEKDKAAVFKVALDHYLDLFYGKILREGESADPFWTKEAGLAAGKLLERLGRWDEAINIYRRLQEMLPVLRDQLNKRIESVREQMKQPQS